jgi:hypothetical protein
MTGSLYVAATLGAATATAARATAAGETSVCSGSSLSALLMCHVCVLAELAAEVAAGGAEGQHRGARQEVVGVRQVDTVTAKHIYARFTNYCTRVLVEHICN